MAYAIEEVADIQEKVLNELNIGRSLRQVCQDEGMPDVKTIGRWLIADNSFALKYAQARMAQANGLFDRMEAVEEAVSAGTMDSHAARVVLDSMRWRASKLAPKVYGDRMAVEVTETRISISGALAAAEQRVALIDARDVQDVQEVQQVQRNMHSINAIDVHEVHEVHIDVQNHVHEVQQVLTTKAPAIDARAARLAKLQARLGKG